LRRRRCGSPEWRKELSLSEEWFEFGGEKLPTGA
jgi:hypothetical protein